MSDHSLPPQLNRLAESYPIGGTNFAPWYFNFLKDFARLPWPRIPQNTTQAMVKMAAERMRQNTRYQLSRAGFK